MVGKGCKRFSNTPILHHSNNPVNFIATTFIPHSPIRLPNSFYNPVSINSLYSGSVNLSPKRRSRGRTSMKLKLLLNSA